MGTTGTAWAPGSRSAPRADTARRRQHPVACRCGALVTDDPASPHLALSHARASLVFGQADQDRSLPSEAIATLGASLASRA